MLLSNRILRLLLDSAESHGISRADVIRALGPEGEGFVAPSARVEWSAIAAVFDEVSRLVGHDREKLFQIGRDMRSSKSRDIVREVARATLTPRGLFEFVDRWMTPGFPHFRFYIRFTDDHHVQMHATIPEPYRECLAFFQVFEGRLVSMTELMGLPPAKIVESRITPRSADLALDLPRHETLRARVGHAARALFARRTGRTALEEQRQSLYENIEALQRGRDELRALLDRLPDMVIVQAGGRVLWANRAFLEILGYESLDALRGTPLPDLFAARSRADVIARMARAPDSLPAFPPLTEFYFLTTRGEEVLLEVTPPQAVVFDGVPARMVVGRDVSERARMQQKLIVADRLASVGLLAAGVAHEVNNPLAYVLNNIEIARKLVSGLGEKADTARDVLAVALEGVDRIGVIVRDLLMLARGDDRPAQAIDLSGVVQSTLALAAREIERTGRLALEMGPAPLVVASEARVAQILLNLVGNALEAMRGRRRDECELRVRVGTFIDGRFLLEVTDTGVGIAATHVGRVFEPFFTTKPAGRGTGLGLSIAHRLVVELGGEIVVMSEEGQGTTFRVLLPASASPISERPERRAEA